MSDLDSGNVSHTIRLNCLVLGEKYHQGFDVEIAKSAVVHDLKRAIKDKRPSFYKISVNLLKIWNVDVAIDHNLEEILTDDDPLVRLGLDPKRPLLPIDKLFTVFPEQPDDERLHIVVQRPPDDPATTKLYKKNATRFQCLQVIVSNLQSWEKEDVKTNLNGGNIFNNGDNRTCPILAGIEARIAQRRTYSVSAGQESQGLQIARTYSPQFDEIFVETQAPSAAVKDDREFSAFFNVLQCYHPYTERIQTKELSSLKASTLIAYFILPSFFSHPTECFACKVETPWRFPMFLATPEMALSWCKYYPKNDFMVTSFLCPFIFSEVVSAEKETNRHCMLLQAIAISRVGQYLVKAGEQFFVVAIYLTANLIAERYIVAQTEPVEDVPSESRPKVSIARKDFNLGTESEAVSFLREMYNLSPMLEDLASKLDPKKKGCLRDIASAATDVHSLTNMAAQRQWARQTVLEADDDLGIFGADDIQDVLNTMEFTVDFILFGHPFIAVVSNLIDDSKKGYLKFVRSGMGEITTLQYLTQINSPRNHTISGVGIWPVRGGHVILMPMAGTWLTELREPSARLWSVAEQLFEAVDFMHQHGVAHLDLKPGNILIPLNGGRLSIIDFYTSVRVEGVKDMFRGAVGTPGYIAPEVAVDRGFYSAVRADLWSCGKTLYQLCKRCQPSTDRSVLFEIAEQLMDEDPDKRLMMSDVLEMMAQYKANAETGMDRLRILSVGPPEVSA